MSTPLDCTECGACCFGSHDRYIAILPEDRYRPIPPEATHEIDGRRYMKMSCGHCAQLVASPEGRLVCSMYELRPEACRAYRAGSFECNRARHHRGAEAAALRAFALPNDIGLPADAERPVLIVPGAGVEDGAGPVSPSA